MPLGAEWMTQHGCLKHKLDSSKNNLHKMYITLSKLSKSHYKHQINLREAVLSPNPLLNVARSNAKW